MNEDMKVFEQTLQDFEKAVLETVEARNMKWGSAWDEMRNEGLEDHVHVKAHRLCNCPENEKRECLIDLLAYATKRWQRGFSVNKESD